MINVLIGIIMLLLIVIMALLYERGKFTKQLAQLPDGYLICYFSQAKDGHIILNVQKFNREKKIWKLEYTFDLSERIIS